MREKAGEEEGGREREGSGKWTFLRNVMGGLVVML